MSKFTKKATPKTATEIAKEKVAANAKAAPKAKVEKAAKAPKAKKPAAAKTGGTRISKTDERKLIVHTKVNPHREGSGRYKAYEAAKASKKVSDYLATGSKAKYLKKWDEQGLIELKAA